MITGKDSVDATNTWYKMWCHLSLTKAKPTLQIRKQFLSRQNIMCSRGRTGFLFVQSSYLFFIAQNDGSGLGMSESGQKLQQVHHHHLSHIKKSSHTHCKVWPIFLMKICSVFMLSIWGHLKEKGERGEACRLKVSVVSFV